MRDIKIHVPAIPVAQPRPRVAVINGLARAVSNPVKHPITAFKATVRLAAAASYSGPPLEGPLCLTALFVLPRPKNRITKIWKNAGGPREAHFHAKPDIDNLAKGLLDALTGLLWVDDKQVYRQHLSKHLAGADEQPHVEVVIWREED